MGKHRRLDQSNQSVVESSYLSLCFAWMATTKRSLGTTSTNWPSLPMAAKSGMQPDVDLPPYGFGHHPQRISALGQLVRVQRVGVTGVGSGDIDARDVKAQEAAEGCAEYERPQEYRQYR